MHIYPGLCCEAQLSSGNFIGGLCFIWYLDWLVWGTETFELLVSFMVDAKEYGLYIPLDPFLVLVRMVDGQAELLNDEELDRIQPRIEAELEEREWPD